MRNTAVTAILALLSRQQNSSSPREQKQQPSTTAEPSNKLTAMVAPPDQQQQQLKQQQEPSSSATSAAAAATAVGASPSSSCSSSNPASGEADSPAVTSAPSQLTRRPSEPGVMYWTDGKAKTMPLVLRAIAMLSLLLFVSWIWIIGFNLVFAPFSRVSATIAVCLWATLLLPTAVSTHPRNSSSCYQQQLSADRRAVAQPCSCSALSCGHWLAACALTFCVSAPLSVPRAACAVEGVHGQPHHAAMAQVGCWCAGA